MLVATFGIFFSSLIETNEKWKSNGRKNRFSQSKEWKYWNKVSKWTESEEKTENYANDFGKMSLNIQINVNRSNGSMVGSLAFQWLKMLLTNYTSTWTTKCSMKFFLNWRNIEWPSDRGKETSEYDVNWSEVRERERLEQMMTKESCNNNKTIK